jgi:hypothetical protein
MADLEGLPEFCETFFPKELFGRDLKDSLIFRENRLSEGMV